MIKKLMLLVVMLLVAFTALAQDALPNTVNVSDNATFGKILVASNGMTLYTFEKDPLNESVCVDKCLEAWPALTVDSADALSAPEGLPGTLGTIERADGTLQVTYNAMPLYFWFKDAVAGDTTGQNVGQVWTVAIPATVYIKGNADLGSFLVGPNGMTVYMFTKDTAGVSNCTDKCLENWPALTVDSADAVLAGANLPGTLGTIERADASIQVTYNDMPLYYWAKDAAIGDATGEGVGEVWYTVAPETVVVADSTELGSFLVAPNGMTLYMFTKDTAGVSNCADDCATAWPPYVVPTTDRLTLPAGAMGELGMIERADGKNQVTYNGMPLYFWSKDVAAGDTTGQGVGDVWFVVAP